VKCRWQKSSERRPRAGFPRRVWLAPAPSQRKDGWGKRVRTGAISTPFPAWLVQESNVAPTESYRFVIADDHPLFRGAMKQALTGLLATSEIYEAGGFDELQQLLEREADMDLVLLDLAMPGVRGFSGLLYLRAQFPGVPVVVVSANQEPGVIRRCMEFGASGFLPKTLGVDAVREAVRRVLAGEVWTPPDVDLSGSADAATRDLVQRLSTLTPQQVRVLMMLSEGLLNKQIAYALGVSEATVKAHVSAILQKLGVESRTQAVIAAAKIEAGQWPQAVS
jgi:DNA-binding NarL/FixJ family response regulator